MTAYTLVVSNPPHGDMDHWQAAPYLGLASAEVRMKANYPVPEIWLADTDQSKMGEAAEMLRKAGLNVVVLAGDDLFHVPPQAVVQSFAFTDTHLGAVLADSKVELAYDTPITGVLCTPRKHVAPEQSRPAWTNPLTQGLWQRSSSVFMTRDSLVGLGGLGRRTSTAGLGSSSPDVESAFLDLYTSVEGTLRRMSILQDRVDFSGLKELQLPRAADNLAMFVAECEDRFKRGRVDRRLMNMQPRERPVVGRTSSYDAERKGFSYATEALSKLLESISADLKNISQFDLSSRLAYLTTQ